MILTAAAALLLAAGCALNASQTDPLPNTAVESTEASPSVVETPRTDSATPDAIVAPVEAPQEEPALRITVTGTMPFSSRLEPPSMDGVWKVVDAGAGYPADPATSTTYLLAHAQAPWRGHSPGNEWQDFKVGDAVMVNGDSYRATWAGSVPKAEIASAPIWKHVPGRVVLVTCVPQVSGEVAVDNRITILEPAR